eukprot:m.161650 g.161650  ORF g.161650 m.161650 type:complete len:1389 (+) comp14364_c1_seq7:213-4379(+)
MWLASKLALQEVLGDKWDAESQGGIASGPNGNAHDWSSKTKAHIEQQKVIDKLREEHREKVGRLHELQAHLDKMKSHLQQNPVTQTHRRGAHRQPAFPASSEDESGSDEGTHRVSSAASSEQYRRKHNARRYRDRGASPSMHQRAELKRTQDQLAEAMAKLASLEGVILGQAMARQDVRDPITPSSHANNDTPQSQLRQLQQEAEVLRLQEEIEQLRAAQRLREQDGRPSQHCSRPSSYVNPQPPESSTQALDVMNPGPYDPDEGFVLFIDFVRHIPSSIKHCSISFVIWNNETADSKVYSTLPISTETITAKKSRSAKHARLTKAALQSLQGQIVANESSEQRTPTPRVQTASASVSQQSTAMPDLDGPVLANAELTARPFVIKGVTPSGLKSLLFVIQDRSNLDNPRGTVFGWTKLQLFDSENSLGSGRWRLNICKLPVKQALASTDVVEYPSFDSACLAVRLVDGRWLEKHKSLPVKSALWHSYLRHGILGADLKAKLQLHQTIQLKQQQQLLQQQQREKETKKYHRSRTKSERASEMTSQPRKHKRKSKQKPVVQQQKGKKTAKKAEVDSSSAVTTSSPSTSSSEASSASEQSDDERKRDTQAKPAVKKVRHTVRRRETQVVAKEAEKVERNAEHDRPRALKKVLTKQGRSHRIVVSVAGIDRAATLSMPNPCVVAIRCLVEKTSTSDLKPADLPHDIGYESLLLETSSAKQLELQIDDGLPLKTTLNLGTVVAPSLRDHFLRFDVLLSRSSNPDPKAAEHSMQTFATCRVALDKVQPTEMLMPLEILDSHGGDGDESASVLSISSLTYALLRFKVSIGGAPGIQQIEREDVGRDVETETPIEDLAKEIPQGLFIWNPLPPAREDVYLPSDGFDLYVDGCRWLPQNVLLSKVVGRVSGAAPAVDIDTINQTDSICINPTFNFRREFRDITLHPHSQIILQVSVVALHEGGEPSYQQLGFASFPLFSERGTWSVPTFSTSQLTLNTGAYQLQIFRRLQATDHPGDSSTTVMQGVTPIPCATLLIRILPSIKNDDGQSLSISDVPAEQWSTSGLIVPAPAYDTGTYISHFARPTSRDVAVFNNIQSAQLPLNVREAFFTYIDASSKKGKKHSKAKLQNSSQITRLMSRRLNPPPNYHAHPMLLQYLVPFDGHGLTLVIHRAKNLPKAKLHHAVASVVPPMGRYNTLARDMSLSRFTTSFDEQDSTCCLNHPVWNSKPMVFSKLNVESMPIYVIEIFSVDIKVQSTSAQVHAYLPCLFPGEHDVVYARTGNYCVPTFTGPVQSEVLSELIEVPPDRFDEKLSEMIKIKRLFQANAVVYIKVMDCRLSEDLAESEDIVVPLAALKSQQAPSKSKHVGSVAGRSGWAATETQAKRAMMATLRLKADQAA